MTGFDFSFFLRNQHLAAQNNALPKTTSTGTTIVGCVFDDGVVLGADTRATGGSIVAGLPLIARCHRELMVLETDKNCEKVRLSQA